MLSAMLSKLLAFLILFFSLCLQTNAELKLSNWKTYTSMANVRAVTTDSRGRIWAATAGGLFIYDPAQDSIKELRNTDGLLSLDLTAIKYNPSDSLIYIGSSDGYLQISTEDFQWKYVTDIVTEKFPDPAINNILFYDDFALFSGGFGISKFDLKNKVFIETVRRFGDMATNAKVNQIMILGNDLWAATQDGVMRVNIDNSIANPESWDVFTAQNGLPNIDVNYMVNFNDTLYVATKNNICKFSGNQFSTEHTSNEYDNITGLTVKNDTLIYSTPYFLLDLQKNIIQTEIFWRNLNGISQIKINGVDYIVMLYKDFGLSIVYGSINKHIMPNTPVTNNFMDLDIDNKGRIWVATKSKDRHDGTGFMMLDKDDTWTNFNHATDTLIENGCLKIKAISDGRVFASTWGKGLFIVEENNGKFQVSRYDTSNSPLVGAKSNILEYVITSGITEDIFGDVWLINYGEDFEGPFIVKVDKNNNFQTIPNRVSAAERQYLEIAIDQWGTKWFGSNFGKGLLYYNDNGTIDDLTDDKYGKVTTSNSDLSDNDQTALVVDKTGFIWIGTGNGLDFIYDTYSALTGDKIYVRDESHLRTQFVRDIYVDALNYKWIATNKGVWVLNEDASGRLNEEILNSTNSPLINDDVYSITSDPSTGMIYFGTRSGMSVAQSNSVLATAKYDIKCFPQPFNLLKDDALYIDGLEENSDVRILTIDGYLVKSLNAMGRIVSWDGKDESGTLVASGVYLVVGSSATTKDGAAGKFTVIRK